MKRYEVLCFPALYGKPIRTNSIFLAKCLAKLRSLFYTEARIIDTKTGEHVVSRWCNW